MGSLVPMSHEHLPWPGKLFHLKSSLYYEEPWGEKVLWPT